MKTVYLQNAGIFVKMSADFTTMIDSFSGKTSIRTTSAGDEIFFRGAGFTDTTQVVWSIAEDAARRKVAPVSEGEGYSFNLLLA